MGLGTKFPRFDAPFVGRQVERELVRDHVARGARVITLLGPGGVGKTRLASEFAKEAMARDKSLRAWFCDLSPARTLDDLNHAVVRALRLPVEALRSGDTSDKVGGWLARQGPALMVLDNFEQLAAFARETVGTWQALADEVILLVTSREPLRIPLEVVIPVEPLAVPAANEERPELVAASEAVQLFLAKATPITLAGIDLDADAAVLAATVRRLDGLPLAIELAAARLELLPLREIHDRLARRFELLRLPDADPTDRRGTLWGAIAWSWHLLSGAQQEALAQATVFAGGFSLDAAEAVIELSAGASVLDALQGLCQKCLVRIDRSRGQAARFDMLESVREYAEALPSSAGARVSAAARHDAYYLRRGEEWAAAVDRHGGLAALEQLATEHENLTAVFHRASARTSDDPGAPASLLRAVLALGPLYAARGPVRAHIRMLDAAIAVSAESAVQGLKALGASALLARGRAQRFEGRFDAALADLGDALRLAREIASRPLEGVVVGEIGAVEIYKGQGDAALAHYAEALAIHREVGDRRHEGIALARMGLWYTQHSELERAELLLLESLAILREVGDRQFEGFALHYLGGMFLEQGRLDPCTDHETPALAIFREIGSRLFEASALGHLGVADHLQGEPGRARARYLEALAICAEIDQRWLAGIYSSALGMLDAEEGAMGAAHDHLTAALALVRSAGDSRYEGLILTMLAGCEALQGNVPRAQVLLDEGAAVLSTVGDRVLERIVEVARGCVDVAQTSSAEQAGERALAAANLARARGRLIDDDGSLSVDTRFMRRLLSRAIDRASNDADAWVVDRRSAWFAPPGGERIVLAPGSPTWRVFIALVERRLETDAAPISIEDLVAAGWPETRLTRSAAQNRLHVALNALRRRGLKSILRRNERGYELDPAVRVRLVTAEET